MHEARRKATWAWGARWIGGVTVAAFFAATPLVSGCAVSESDVHRWETTEHGPEKLYAIVTHDKYSWKLREEATLSLIRMKPRAGERIGLKYLVAGFDTPERQHVPGALVSLSEDARKRIVNDIAPRLIEQINLPVPPKNPDGSLPPDPSVPYKDAAFAMLSHEPPLVSDEKTKADLIAAITHWSQTDFDARIDNTAQQYGLEQVMRFIGPAAVKALPSVINEQSAKVDRATALIADIGDDETKKRGGEALVAMAKSIDSPAWLAKQKPLVEDANKRIKVTATPEQLTEQLKKFQEQELEKVFSNMKRLGTRPVVDYCIAYAGDKSKSGTMRLRALAAIENRVDKNNAADVQHIFDMVRDDGNPDDVRGLALRRLGELPKEQIVSKLYSLFEGKKWQVRLDAANLLLKVLSTKDVPDFMRHLPQTAKDKMALSEPLSYGALVMAMEPQGGPTPREVLKPYLTGKELGPKLTAIGSYYGGKKADAQVLNVLETDAEPVPKCEEADHCGWACDVPKAGAPAGEKETKAISTVGEFVKFCVEPSLHD